MLIVMSDLHLAEASSYALGEVKFDNNLPASVYSVYFNEIPILFIKTTLPRLIWY